MTRDEFNKLPSNGQVACPDCGLKSTEPCGGCHCPSGLFTTHINKYHHNCERALEKAYPTNKKNFGRGAVIEAEKEPNLEFWVDLFIFVVFISVWIVAGAK